MVDNNGAEMDVLWLKYTVFTKFSVFVCKSSKNRQLKTLNLSYQLTMKPLTMSEWLLLSINEPTSFTSGIMVLCLRRGLACLPGVSKQPWLQQSHLSTEWTSIISNDTGDTSQMLAVVLVGFFSCYRCSFWCKRGISGSNNFQCPMML